MTAEAKKIKGFIKKQLETKIPEEGLRLAIRQINKERMLLKNNHKRRNSRQEPMDTEPCGLRLGIASNRPVNTWSQRREE